MQHSVRMFTSGIVAVACHLGLAGWGQAAPEPVQAFEHGGPVVRLAFSPDGKILASGGGSGYAKISLWNLQEGEPIGDLTAHRGAITGLVFSENGKHLATSAWDGQVILWDTTTLEEIRSFEGHEGGVTGLALSPDGRTLATGGIDGTVRLWNVATGKERKKLEKVPRRRLSREPILGVAFSADGAAILVQVQECCGVETRVYAFATAAGNPIDRIAGVSFDFEGQQPLEIRAVQRRLEFLELGLKTSGYGSGFMRTVARFDLAERGSMLPEFSGTKQGSFDSFSADARTLAYLGSRRVTFLETATGQNRFEYQAFDWINAVALAPGGKHVAWAEGDHGEVQLWSIAELIGIEKPFEKPTTADFEKNWAELAADAPRAYRASWLFSAAPADAVPLLREKVLASPKVDLKRVARLVADLDAPMFPVRQKASEELETLGLPALRALNVALAAKPSLELTRRAERVVFILEEKLQDGVVRGVRAIEVLERIGSPQARDVLAELARGAPAVQREAATQALRRLNRP